MADEPILGLFDSDSNFLDELTGGAGDLGVMSSDGDSMLGQSMHSLGPTSGLGPGSGPQTSMLMGQQHPQASAGYAQMHPGQDSYSGMTAGGGIAASMGGPQQQMMNHQYSNSDSGYYSSVPKLHHPGDGVMGMGVQHQSGMQVIQQQQQFGSPPAGSSMMQQHSNYQSYNMGSSHMGQQSQQMGIMGQQTAGTWNQQQTSPTHSQYISQQQQQQCIQQPMSQGYMGQHDYGMQQASHQQHISHYGESGNQAGYMQAIGSPGPSLQQASPIASPGGINMMQNPMQRPPRPQQPFSSQSPVHQSNPGIGSYAIHQQQPRYSGDYLGPRPQSTTQAKLQHFSYPQQHQNTGAGSQGYSSSGTSSASMGGCYSNRSPSSSYMSTYPGTSQTASPHPPPISQSLTPSHNASISQGTYGQSSLQELEQLVSPVLSSGGMPSTNPYQQIMQSPGSSAQNMPQSPSYSSAPFQTTTTVPSSGSMSGSAPVQSSAGLSMNVGSSLSPNPSIMQSIGQGMGPQSNVAMEIQRLDKQIQHLFNLPQTQQISQQMLDLQERLRILKAQQQQQLMHMQRQQQPQQLHMTNPVRMSQKPAFGSQQHSGLIQRGMGPGQMNGPPQSQISSMPHLGQHIGQGVPIIGAQNPQQLQVQTASHMGQQISPQRPPSQSPHISSPQRIQPFQSPTSSTSDCISGQIVSSSQSLVVQQAADSMTADLHQQSAPDSMQLTPPHLHSYTRLDLLSDGDVSSQTNGQVVGRGHGSGNMQMTQVATPDPLPATVTEIAEAQEGQGEKPKRKRVRKPKAEKPEKPPKAPRIPKPPKAPKEPKPPKPPKEPKAPKTPRTPKPPKTPKDPKAPKTPRGRKKKIKTDEGTSSSGVDTTTTDIDMSKVEESGVIHIIIEEGKIDDKVDDAQKKKALKEKKPKTPKTVVKALKKPSTKKRKPPASLFLKGKKRKRTGSDGSDVEITVTPPESPMGDDTNKRRSARNTKRKKYLDDLDLNLSDDDNQALETGDGMEGPVTMKTDSEEDALVVEKILGNRIRKRDAEEAEENPDAEEEEEFLVKYKNYSFLHCEWRTVTELERDKRIHSKVKRYKMKKLQMGTYFEEPEDEEYFNPEYVEVDRVLEKSSSIDPVTSEEVTHYLVKWRALSYEESTWELAQDVDPRKVQLFMELKTMPPEDQRQVLARPKPSQWKKAEDMRDYKGGNSLREYQLEGLNWLTFCWYNGQNCILADEMGLGKTIQSITFLNEMFQYGIKGPFLVVVPLSTIGNWQREFETWTDMNAVVYHGTSNSRSMIQEYELFYKDENGQRIPEIYRFHALITTYEIIIADVELLSSIEWRCCVIDEAHRLKNKNCRLLEGLRLFDLEHRVLLTGTPLQNNTEELFSLLNFLNPGKFSSSQAFIKDFGELRTESQVEQLKEILKPMMLRRLKEDVEKNLAPKEETIIEVELTNIQKKYYRAILERNFQFLSKSGNTNMPSLMNTMMELRKCCNHPYLINGAEEQILHETGARGDIDQMLAAMVNSSGKMVLLDKLLPRLKQNGHKVLIFSQMIRVLDIIEDYLVQKKYLYERLDGRIRGNLRQEAIDRFSKPDSDRFAFLLCTRAGGLGINLTAADTVIIYDSDWNPQNDLQAQARCHRIGQSKAVKVYRLITRNSYEREMFDKASLKLGLDKAVLQSMAGDKPVNTQNQMSKKEIEDLLKKGAYGAIMDDDNAGDQFCEEDIDLILQRRTKVIQIESEGKGSTFAKASFSMTSNRNDIDINDPNFWQKWAKKADVDVDSIRNKNDLIIEEPRQRRQTARYGKEESVVDMSDLDSSTDSDEERHSLRRGRKTRRGRGNDEDYTYNDDISTDGYSRSDCFKVEKHLLIYGWGRWQDIIAHARFKHQLAESDVQIIARAILAHSLKFYKGDERIKEFIWDLVANSNEGELKNHTGLSAPVPRGRKGKKAKEKARWTEEGRPLDFDPEAVLDNGYKRHLHRHSNKVLLRVRLLYYIKQEVIGKEAIKVFQGVNASEIDIPPPISDGEVPAAWWDECADRCLLIGIFKHGYEKFNQVRQDPTLCFLSRCGPPDGAALLAEQNDDKEDEDEMDEKLLKDDDDGELSQSSNPEICSIPRQPISTQTDEYVEGGKLPFPLASDLNTRLRRVITGYQRNHKKMMMKHEQHARRLERRERAELMLKQRESKRKEFQQSRWSRREEADFYRTVSTFGVEFDRLKGRFKWDRFRALARLDRKHDDALTEYFHAFYYMCQSVCGKFRTEDRVPPPPNGIFVEPITEERASRCLARIDLLNKIRDEILLHPKLEERIKLCQPSFDMPTWWQCGKHDQDLLLGAARHGVARTDYNILRDLTLSFHEILKNSGRHLRSNPQLYAPSPLVGTAHASHISGMAPDLREEDLESDAKSQDSVDSRDFRTGSPPPLHNGEVQYPISNTDNDRGPPQLEPAVTPLHRQEEVSRDSKPSTPNTAERKRDTDNENVCVSELRTSNITKRKVFEIVNENKVDILHPRLADGHLSMDEMNKLSSESDSETKVSCVKTNPPTSLSETETSDICSAEVIDINKDNEVSEEDQMTNTNKSNGEGEKLKDDNVENQSKVGVKKETIHDQNCIERIDVKDENVKIENQNGVEGTITMECIKKVKVEVEEVKSEHNPPELLEKVDKEEKELEDGEEVKEFSVGVSAKEEKDDFVKLKEKVIKGEMDRFCDEEHCKEGNFTSLGISADGMSPIPSSYSNTYGGDSPYMEMEGLEPGEIIPGQPFLGPAIEWPKDRVIFHRLEHVCYTVEHGEWPFQRRPSSYIPPPPYDSRSGTPVGSSTPRPESSLADSEPGDTMEVNQVMRQINETDKDFEVHLSENEGLKMTFHKRGRGPARRYEMDAEKVARVQQLLNQGTRATPSSDGEGQTESLKLSTPKSSYKSSSSLSAIGSQMADSPLNGSLMSEMDQLEQGFVYPERRRRGRKRKAEKMAELAMAEALAKREQARILASLDADSRVPVINVEDGSVLTGDDAPPKRDLERWLHEHPGFMISPQPTSFMNFPIPGLIPEEHTSPSTDLQSEQVMKRRGRRPRLDPRTLDAECLTGEENVSVIERVSGRKITGAKAPPLKHLKEWLEQNPSFDVEPKWGELIRNKGSLPQTMDSRLLKPSGRGRKPRSSGTVHAMLNSEFQFGAGMAGMPGFPGAGMLAGFPKLPLGMPFPNMAGLGLTNPMLGLAGFPLAGFALPGALGKAEGEGEASTSKESNSKNTGSVKTSESSGSSSTSTASPHPSFPNFYFNPVLYNPLLAGGLRNFPMANFPNLSHMATLNGQSETGASESQPLSTKKEKKLSEKIRELFKSNEKVQNVNRLSERADDMSRTCGKASDVSKPSGESQSLSKSSDAAQDLSVKRVRVSSSPTVNVNSSVQEQATDLSLRRKPSLSSTSKSKNKIFSSLKLNKIVDSLKDKVMKIEEKTKKREDDPVKPETDQPAREESEAVHTVVKESSAQVESEKQILQDSNFETNSSDRTEAASDETVEPNASSE